MRGRFCFSLILTLATFTATATPHQQPNPTYEHILDSVVARYHLPGIALGVIEHGKVVYIDPPASAGDIVHVRSDQSATGPSGLFMLYTDTLASVKVSGGGKTRTVTLGTTDDYVGGAFIVMN